MSNLLDFCPLAKFGKYILIHGRAVSLQLEDLQYGGFDLELDLDLSNLVVKFGTDVQHLFGSQGQSSKSEPPY